MVGAGGHTAGQVAVEISGGQTANPVERSRLKLSDPGVSSQLEGVLAPAS
jgi:hypothetical protein